MYILTVTAPVRDARPLLRHLSEQLSPKYLLPPRMTALDATAAERQRAARDVERRPHAVSEP